MQDVKNVEVEAYVVKILRDTDTGVAVMEEWGNAEGLLHRVGGPSLVTRRADGSVASKHWHKDGVPTKPATYFPPRNGLSSGYLREDATLWSNGKPEQVRVYMPPVGPR
jgi:hypothetical protein